MTFKAFVSTSSETGDERTPLPRCAGGPPRLPNLPVLAGVYQEPPGPAQHLPRQRRAKRGGSGRGGGAPVAHSAGGERLGEV
ncbi:Protein FMC1 -like protein, partial [Takifugu flavidus]